MNGCLKFLGQIENLAADPAEGFPRNLNAVADSGRSLNLLLGDSKFRSLREKIVEACGSKPLQTPALVNPGGTFLFTFNSLCFSVDNFIFKAHFLSPI